MNETMHLSSKSKRALSLFSWLKGCDIRSLKQCRFIDVVRFDGPLFFANASYLEEQIRNRRLQNKELKHFYPTVDAAVSAIHASTHFGENETDCPLKTVCLVSHQRVEREN
jgi:hypothetical protein